MNEISKNIDSAIQLLQKAGFETTKCKDEYRIRGGTKRTETEIENISILANAFSISFENDSWIVVVPYKGQLDKEQTFISIEEAINYVIEYYKNELPKYRN